MNPRWPWFALILTTLLLVGCAAHPEKVFFDSTRAFADGDVDRGMSHFSTRLKGLRSRNDLEYYYSAENNRKGVEFLLEEAKFQMVDMDERRAIARVIWTTGRIEPIYFVKEDGKWCLDLPPATETKPTESKPTGSKQAE